MRPALRLALILGVTTALTLTSAACRRYQSLTQLTAPATRIVADGATLSEWSADTPDAISDQSGRARSDLPPTVTITSPRPSALLEPVVPPDFTIQWASEDPDGPGRFPKSYRTLLLREDDPDFATYLVNPDSLRRKSAPRFDGWTELGGRVETAALSGLEINRRYLFVITAIDRRGSYDPVFSLNRNMLVFVVSAAAAQETPAAVGAEGPSTRSGR